MRSRDPVLTACRPLVGGDGVWVGFRDSDGVLVVTGGPLPACVILHAIPSAQYTDFLGFLDCVKHRELQ